jgi:hypothetical protein
MSKLDEIVLAINPRLSEFPDQLVEAEQAIQQLIDEELAKARIDELNRIPRTNYGNDFAIHINAYLDDRIAELRDKE